MFAKTDNCKRFVRKHELYLKQSTICSENITNNTRNRLLNRDNVVSLLSIRYSHCVEFLQKIRENQVDSHHLFVDYKAAFTYFLRCLNSVKIDKTVQKAVQQHQQLRQDSKRPFRTLWHCEILQTRRLLVTWYDI